MGHRGRGRRARLRGDRRAFFAAGVTAADRAGHGVVHHRDLHRDDARVLVLALLAQAIVALGYVYASDLGSFYTVAALFGFTYAGVMPLFAVIARENFPLRMMGTVIGATTTASSLGMALGPVLGGVVYDTFSSYAWLFIGAFSLAIDAFLAALAFTRLPRRQVMPLGA
jgi:MFS family permease